MKKDRVLYIDALKGFAIILVIIGHIADGYLRANIFTENRNVLHFTYNIIYSFHMPLFLFISGYVYYLAYFKNKTVDKKKIIIQLINIFLLYVMFSIVQWCFKYFISSLVNTKVTINDLLSIFIKPMAPYWYLYNLFFYYIITFYIEKIHSNKWVDIAIIATSVLFSIIFNHVRLI